MSNHSAAFDETFDSTFAESKKSGANSPPVKKLLRWPTIKPWFSAHTIAKLDDSYVVTVKYAQVMRIFVTGTSKGEVKLWSNDTDCTLLGVINNPNRPWDQMHIMSVIA
jgi:hypothetical protein